MRVHWFNLGYYLAQAGYLAGLFAGFVLYLTYLPGFEFLVVGAFSLAGVGVGLHLMAVGYFGNASGRDKSKHLLHLPRVLVRDGDGRGGG